MQANQLSDLVGKECVLIESGQGFIVRLEAVSNDGDRLCAQLVRTVPGRFSMNRIRTNGEPAIAGWHDDAPDLAKTVTIAQPQDKVFRSPRAYVHFSSPYGGTRLLFLDEYVDKVRRKDEDGWDWNRIMEVARAEDATITDRDGGTR